MSRIQQLLKIYKTMQVADPDTIEVTLRDECIDKWTVKFSYPENKCVILDFEFHLIENLPPKVTVVFPSAIQYVCFQELGGKTWTSNGDVPTLIFALQQEYKGRSAVFEESKKLGVTEAIAQWKFVQGAHKDWDYVDITELTSKLSTTEIEQWRKEAVELAQDPQKLEEVFKKLDEAEMEAIKNTPEPPKPTPPVVVPAPVPQIPEEPEIEFEGPQFPFAALPGEEVEPVLEPEYLVGEEPQIEQPAAPEVEQAAEEPQIELPAGPEPRQEANELRDEKQENVLPQKEEAQNMPAKAEAVPLNHVHNVVALAQVPEVV